MSKNPSVWLRDTLFKGDIEYMLHKACGGIGGCTLFYSFLDIVSLLVGLIITSIIGLIVGILWDLYQHVRSSSKFDWWDVFYTWIGFNNGYLLLLIVYYIKLLFN